MAYALRRLDGHFGKGLDCFVIDMGPLLQLLPAAQGRGTHLSLYAYGRVVAGCYLCPPAATAWRGPVGSGLLPF